MAELADALDLGSSDVNRGGSNPPARTMAKVVFERLMPMKLRSAVCRRVSGKNVSRRGGRRAMQVTETSAEG